MAKLRVYRLHATPWPSKGEARMAYDKWSEDHLYVEESLEDIREYVNVAGTVEDQGGPGFYVLLKWGRDEHRWLSNE